MAGFVVVVSFGTRAHQVYARVDGRPDAEALKRTAIKFGYRDAKIVDADRFDQDQTENSRSKVDA